MPNAAPRPCTQPGCPRYQVKGSRCAEHQPKRAYDPKQNRHKRGYGSDWETLRDYVLMRDDGLCQPCRRNQIATAASEVDHIIAKGLGGTDDTDNLQSICKPCHKRKTKEDVRAIRAHGGKFQEGG